MSRFVIKYYLEPINVGDKAVLLGVDAFCGTSECHIPDYSANGHPITLTKFFHGHVTYKWLIKDLVHLPNNVTAITLEGRSNSLSEEFLKQTIFSNRSVINKLQFGTLVEVEFGYISSVKRSNGIISENERYPDSIQKGEIHKRRLCVVVKADGNRVQVVPITSKAKSTSDLSMVQLSQDSLKDISGYNAQTNSSTAICRMIKTVSTSRVLPPLAFSGGTTSPFRDKKYSKKLTGVDIQKLRQSLSHAVGLSDYNLVKDQHKIFFEELRVLRPIQEQFEAATERLNERESELQALKTRYDALHSMMVEWRLGSSIDDRETAERFVDGEVDTYLELYK